MVFADMRLDQQARRRARRRQAADRPGRAEGQIADAAHVDDRRVRFDLLDDSGKLGDHAGASKSRRAVAWCAWHIATASASAASGWPPTQPGSSRRTINCTCDFFVCDAATT